MLQECIYKGAIFLPGQGKALMVLVNVSALTLADSMKAGGKQRSTNTGFFSGRCQ